MGGVDADVDEDVEGGDFGYVDGDQAAVCVVHEEVAAEGAGGVVIDAAGAVCHIAHDDGFGAGAEAGEDVGDGGGEEKETFGELEGDFFGAGGANAMDCLWDLEGVVGWEERYCFDDVGVIKDLGWDLVQGSGCPSGLRDCRIS